MKLIITIDGDMDEGARDELIDALLGEIEGRDMTAVVEYAPDDEAEAEADDGKT